MNVVFFVVLVEGIQLVFQPLLVSFVALKVQFEELKLFGLLKELFHELIIAMFARLQLLNNLRENLDVVLAFIWLLLNFAHLIEQLIWIPFEPVTQLCHSIW